MRCTNPGGAFCPVSARVGVLRYVLIASESTVGQVAKVSVRFCRISGK